MPATVMRNIVKIDPDKCNGCGQCVPNCVEGAIEIVDGKARLAGEDLCDGLGACLGTCPQGAITIEQRPAEAFDEQAGARRKGHQQAEASGPEPCGCPGAAFRTLPRSSGASSPEIRSLSPICAPSQLAHWPVQLALVPMRGQMWQDADVLIAADCVAFALPDFHERLLAGKSLAVACPKLDDTKPQIEKLTAIFAYNDIRSVTVAHMEVPCCGGIVRAVQEALRLAGKTHLPLADVTVGIDGAVLPDR